MSNRERWILYPLVFLSLGLGLRDRFLQFDTRTVAARDVQAQLLKSDAIAARQLRAESSFIDTVTCRRLIVAGDETAKTAAVVLAANDQRQGIIQVLDPEGRSQVTLVATPVGGIIRTLTPDGKLLVLLDQDSNASGRVGICDRNNLLFFVRPTIGPIKSLEVPDAPPITDPAPEGEQSPQDAGPDGEPPAAPPAIPPATEPER